MLTAYEIQQLLTLCWSDAQNECGKTLERIKVVDAHVSDIPNSLRQINDREILAQEYSLPNTSTAGVRLQTEHYRSAPTQHAVTS